MERKTKSITYAEGKEILFETGKIARQANGAVLVRIADTMVFASACAQKELKSEDESFLPLRVDYCEKFFSAGKTLGGFIKREGRPTEKETLVSRLIDRPLRPLFEKGYFNEVQLLTYVWSYDGIHLPDPLAICAASAALVISDIPLSKPVAGVRVGLCQGKFVINPTLQELATSELDLLLAGTEEAILMIEGYANFLTEEQILEAVATGHESIKKICAGLSAWQQEIGKPKDRSTIKISSDEVYQTLKKELSTSLEKALAIVAKQEREEGVNRIQSEMISKFANPEGDAHYSELSLKGHFKKIQSDVMRSLILQKGLRSDGRGLKDIRFIDIEPALLPRAHGSCLFTRGETQTVAVCTLGGENMGQRYEDLDGEGLRRFYLQYFFPPFSVGEVGRVGSPGRREVGHGKLAERALAAILPSAKEFPYTIRLESNITESNGSSSMASVCGGCLAMMDAGVPLQRPVAGIAMGLILDKSGFAILSDILGIEDALGDMDFKVAGDKEGITAFQMDIKVEGITLEIMSAALMQAREGRLHILQKMLEAVPIAKKEMSIYAPRIETMQIKPSQIAIIIGPGGKQIRAITEETGVKIDINDTGLVSIAATHPDAMARAKSIIESLTGEIEIGKLYQGKIASVVDFGIFVEIFPGKQGLCHISELAETRVPNIFEHVKEGQIIAVKVLEINERGQIKLSHKATLPGAVDTPRDPSAPRSSHNRPPRPREHHKN